MNNLLADFTGTKVLNFNRRLFLLFSRSAAVFIFTSTVFLFSCEREDMYNTAKNTYFYHIGDTGPGGGIVFYIIDSGLHGMEVAMKDQGAAMEWTMPALNHTMPIGITSTFFGTGRANTEAIILQAGHSTSPAQICRDYRGGGYDDWYLPSIDELKLMHDNLKDKYSTYFTGSSFWSSSESSADRAWYYAFDIAIMNSNYKNGTGNIRAVRNF